MFQLIPKEQAFFDLFERAAQNAHEATQALVELLERFDDPARHARRIKEFEHIGDELTHQIIERLNRTFITPLDREDIHELACRMDDVLDLVDTASDRLVLFKIQKPIDDSRQLAECLVRATALLCGLMPLLRHTGNTDLVRQRVLEVHRLESEADRIERHALAALCENSADPMTAIKWIQIIEALESATDRCEDVANVIEGIVLKNA